MHVSIFTRYETISITGFTLEHISTLRCADFPRYYLCKNIEKIIMGTTYWYSAGYKPVSSYLVSIPTRYHSVINAYDKLGLANKESPQMYNPRHVMTIKPELSDIM